jgi:hypothetical protein
VTPPDHYGPPHHNWFTTSCNSLGAAADHLRRGHHGFALGELESAFSFAVLAWLEFKQVPRTKRDANWGADYHNFQEARACGDAWSAP